MLKQAFAGSFDRCGAWAFAVFAVRSVGQGGAEWKGIKEAGTDKTNQPSGRGRAAPRSKFKVLRTNTIDGKGRGPGGRLHGR